VFKIKYMCTKRLLTKLVLICRCPRYRSLTPALAYSICLYVAVSYSACFNVRHHLQPLFKQDDDFRDSIYTFKLITMLANCTCVPVLAWLDTPRVVRYLKKWENFQVRRASQFLNSEKKITLLIFMVRSSNLDTKILMIYYVVFVILT
jgi:hypothetical protein